MTSSILGGIVTPPLPLVIIRPVMTSFMNSPLIAQTWQGGGLKISTAFDLERMAQILYLRHICHICRFLHLWGWCVVMKAKPIMMTILAHDQGFQPWGEKAGSKEGDTQGLGPALNSIYVRPRKSRKETKCWRKIWKWAKELKIKSNLFSKSCVDWIKIPFMVCGLWA